MEFLEAISRATDVTTVLPIMSTVHDHWYISQLEVPDWTLDMKVEALIPTIIAILNPKTAKSILSEVSTDITACISHAKEHDMTGYKHK